ncbi:MAG: hypothetical protein J7507_05250, partial [Pseudoxanthomonas sp.]|nr:hypothetical protein [Pseudoxanthomonas sp.]
MMMARVMTICGVIPNSTGYVIPLGNRVWQVDPRSCGNSPVGDRPGPCGREYMKRADAHVAAAIDRWRNAASAKPRDPAFTDRINARDVTWRRRRGHRPEPCAIVMRVAGGTRHRLRRVAGRAHSCRLMTRRSGPLAGDACGRDACIRGDGNHATTEFLKRSCVKQAFTVITRRR